MSLLDVPYAPLGGGTYVAKPAGSAAAGVRDWGHESSVGYLDHLRSGAGSGAGTFLTAYGTDKGQAGGILISHKNTGAAFQIDHQPGSALANYWKGYSVNALLQADIYAGSGAMLIKAASGAGFNDGVTTQGSTTFTSATAAFTVADVGASIGQLTSRGLNDPSGSIPTGTTIAAYVDAQTVTLSQAAAQSATDLLFSVGGRVPAATQTLLRFADTDNTTLGSVRRGDLIWRTPIDCRSNDAARPAVIVRGHASQTSDIFSVFKDSNSESAVFSILESGRAIGRWGATISNAGDTTQVPMTIQNFATGLPSLQVIGVASQTEDQFAVKNASSQVQSRFNSSGTFMTRVTTAPADSAIASAEMSIWFDSTDGAAKLMIKAKQADGTVRTGSVALT